MIETNVAAMLCKLCFAGGFVVAMVMGLLVIGLFFAARLWTLRDDLKDMGEELTGILRQIKEEEEEK